ncbi:CYFA0S13e00254g1_1 [Cyberlindnera fabianii]|uniref:mitogen-activated protein kinase kinase kinase n=1 Tax=Cyberlindnera fabianii TaxID=36022 RepID=A0A061B1S5_CYBFA|nr:CYFA0S13e00254g1_1 [Cyberlindnera fabianii]
MDSTDELQQWLKTIFLEEYTENFKAFQITYDSLKFLDVGILKDIGIEKIGDRIKIEQEIKKLKDEHYVKLMNIDEMFKSIVQIKRPVLRSLNSSTLMSNHRSEFKLNPPPQRNEKSLVSFILQNGSTVKINVSGCFNAFAIKKKLIKFLDLPNKNVNNYDVYLTDPQGMLHLLFDVELVTICHSNDRIEKHRILFCPKNEQPSPVAIEVSQKYISMEPTKLESDDSTQKINQDQKFRSIFGQRPTSQLISTNLSQYFPQTNKEKLQKTIRNSVRYSVRMSTIGNTSKRMSTVGDFLVDSNSKVDQARLSMSIDTMDSLNLKSSMDQTKQRFSIASTIDSGRNSVIELFDVDSDSDDDEIVTNVNNVNLNSGSMHWLKGARIGSGSFGTVYLGMNALTGELMAVKQVELKPLIDDSKADSEKEKMVHQKIVESLQHEMKLLSELHHDNIVTYLGSSTDENYVNIFLEYVPGGSLNSMLTNYGPFEEPLVRNFTRQILIGLNYLHSKNIIHRDIKGANILIDIKGEVKISDFGISKKLAPSSKNDKRASLQGSVYWMAPEVVKQVATTTKADIWSVGCLIIEMFTGKHPFPNFSQMQAIFKIGTHTVPEIPKWCTEDAKDFLNQTFILDYTKRPSATDLLNHKFLESLIDS